MKVANDYEIEKEENQELKVHPVRIILTIFSFVLFLGPSFSQDTEDLMSMSLDDLLNMEVTTVSKSAEKLSDAPGVISVITKKELEMFGGTTLKDILERIPSLIGSTVYMTDRSTIAPRGDQVLASSSHVLLLINGRPVRESLEGGIKSEMYESFPVNIIEKIEVIRGPGSVLYGSNAFSAVINVITEQAKENTLAVSGLTGVDGEYGSSGKVLLKSGDFSVVAAGRYLKKADWETDFSYANYYIPNVDMTVTTKTTIPNEGTGLYLDINYKNLQFMGAHTYWKNYHYIADFATVFPFPTNGISDWEKTFGDLGYSYQVNDKWKMDFNISYTRSTFEAFAWPLVSRDSYEAVAEWTNFFNPTEKLGIVFGGLYNYFDGEENNPDEGKVTDASRFSMGTYAQMDYKLIEKMKLIGGFQANKVEDIDLNIVPRAGVIWYPFERINVKALYSQAFRAPSINELTIKFSQMRGNPDLVPEKVSTIDFGVNYHEEQIQAGVNFFYSKQTDIIFQDRSGAFPMYNNGTEVTFQGIEFEGKYYINKNVFLTSSILYQTNEDKDKNENVTPVANFGAKAGIGYMSQKGFTASIFNIYQGDLDSKYDTQLNPSPSAYNLMNIHCKYSLNNLININFVKDISLFMQVDNLLDEEIWLPDWGLLPGKSIPVIQGRAIYFGLSATF
jgi:outer membrane receptor for ferrienterochelin and colicins